ncbi:hypothetical protein V6N12_024756 [Hibiscus sabdariffa]|uniref:Uncharacterized protein n=1 Tax=Hibiscus sabdariffa TaxID=183260 RepID=A0ABR2BF69_9ROSI
MDSKEIKWTFGGNRCFVASVPCGLWHTTVVTSAGQLFTFDGTFGVLGHEDRKSGIPRGPTHCLISYGHSMTIALTNNGHVYAMGSPVYMHLWNPQAGRKLSIRVEGKLTKNFLFKACR